MKTRLLPNLSHDLLPLSTIEINKKVVRLTLRKSRMETILLVDEKTQKLYEVIRLFPAPVPNQIRVVRYTLEGERKYGLEAVGVAMDCMKGYPGIYQPPATEEWNRPWDKLGQNLA